MLVKFIRNKSYAGTDYGPEYPESVADVDVKWARVFIAQGAAVAVVAPPPAPPPLSTQSFGEMVESRDPKPSHTRGKRK
jgi:hypothetical protein